MPTPNESQLPPKPAQPPEPKAEVRDPAEIERERRVALLAKVRTVRENAQMRRGSVTNPNPAKSYVWVNVNEHRQIEFQGMGYEVCKDPAVKTAWKKPDGTHQRGDLILYQIDKDLLEAIKVDDELRALEGIDAPKAAFQQQVGRMGGAVFEPTPR